MSEQPPRRKLIEVSLPLEAINRESAREKSVPRKGHPATLHLWWARRPLAAARAVLFAQLVDDPSAHPERFPTEAAVKTERDRLHKMIEELSVWENAHNEKLLAAAREEIRRSCNGDPPPVLDPFAGGGTIPLEAQRLGLEVHASDLNPVAVLINKALIEIPPRFADRPPVFPGLAESELASWSGAAGLAADVRAYGGWMRDQAARRIGHHYPTATLPDGSEAKVIAWIWTRTVTCPNPACGIEMPLVRSWWLGKKKGKEAYVVPRVVEDPQHPSGKRVEFGIGHDPDGPTMPGTKLKQKPAVCIACRASMSEDDLRLAYKRGDGGTKLIATVAAGKRRREYLPPSTSQSEAADVERVEGVEGDLPTNPRWFSPPGYGLTHFSDLFTNRQLLSLTTFSDLVGEVRERTLADALAAGMASGERLTDGGDGAEAHADAVATYLAFVGSKLADWSSSICSWIPVIEGVRDTFARQAIPMTWDFVEINPFSASVGNLSAHIDWVAAGLSATPIGRTGNVELKSAHDGGAVGVMSTDPPYYDNIGYSDLSDFFYVWLRRSLRNVHPNLFSTLLVPKSDELVANPYRHGGKDGARKFFESGFRDVFANARQYALDEFPMTVYYAFKQSDVNGDGESSTGWETLLDGMIGAGWMITATLPMRSERSGRMLSIGTNALASSIVLALRPRPEDAPTADRREFIEALHSELPNRLRELQHGQIAPVDLPQAAIGPGMAVFSHYAAVIEPDGSRMRVRAALARINEILDEVLSEQEGDFDTTTRFALGWYRQNGYKKGKFGAANTLANARNTSVEAMDRAGVLRGAAGDVKLYAPAELAESYDPVSDERISAWEVLHHMLAALARDGVASAAALLAGAAERVEDPVDPGLVKELAYLLFSVAEKSGRTKDALAFNDVVGAWPDIVEAMRAGAGQETQASLDI